MIMDESDIKNTTKIEKIVALDFVFACGGLVFLSVRFGFIGAVWSVS